MKNPNNTKRPQAGFTLVEVIVVAVIVAAMAAVAVPMYLGYVDSSRQNAAANTAGSAASFCGACRNSAGTVTLTVPSGSTSGGTMTCSVGGSSIQIPTDIVVTHVAPNNSATPPTPGVVTGKHVSSAASVAAATFNY